MATDKAPAGYRANNLVLHKIQIFITIIIRD
jgi:hypothetical protein